MELLKKFLHAIRNLDQFLDMLTTEYGVWAYVVLGAIVFAETGLVVTPFLPGDSLLFACGAISVRPGSGLNPIILGTVLIACGHRSATRSTTTSARPSARA
jgi:membrane-associated protein